MIYNMSMLINVIYYVSRNEIPSKSPIVIYHFAMERINSSIAFHHVQYQNTISSYKIVCDYVSLGGNQAHVGQYYVIKRS